MINNKNYSALIDTGASFSLINSKIKDFPKVKLEEPILFSTITNKDVIDYEVCTVAPAEFNLPNNARVKWKAAPLTGRKYDFIIGMDILKFLNAKINVEERKIFLNRKESKFLNSPYNLNQIYTLEATDFNLDKLMLDHLNEEEYREVLALLKRFKNLLFKEGDKLTNTTEIQHEIKTTTQQQINSKLYRYPPQHEMEVRRQIKEMEEQGIIQKSYSRYSSPLIVVPKKIDNSGERKFRLVIDYRKLNDVTIDDKYPLPNIELHLTKPNSHTGNSDIERFHSTIAEKFRILYKLEKECSVKQLIQKAIRNYNERFHSTIKYTPNEVHDNKVDPEIVKNNLETTKHKIINKLNKNRENYEETRTEGFIKNYKAVRHKEQPKFRKGKLENIHPQNIKKPLKFADANNDTSNDDMDTTE